MIRSAAALVVVLLAAACSTASSGDEDSDPFLAVVVHSMGIVGNTANYNVSIANISSDTVKIRSVTVNPGVPREMGGIAVTTEFTLEPGMERSLMAEMRLYPRNPNAPEWPDTVAVDIAYERKGKREGHTYRVDVLNVPQRY